MDSQKLILTDEILRDFYLKMPQQILELIFEFIFLPNDLITFNFKRWI